MPSPGEGLAHRRVLVADDNVDAAEMVATLLEMHGCDVRTAFDGQQAVQEAERFRPELILLDLGMPRVDGYEACRRIRAEAWGGLPLIVALTGWGQQEDRRRSALAGFDAHLVKPADPDTLYQLARDLRLPVA